MWLHIFIEVWGPNSTLHIYVMYYKLIYLGSIQICIMFICTNIKLSEQYQSANSCSDVNIYCYYLNDPKLKSS